MIFPLFKTWLTPIFGSLLTSLRSTQRLGGTPGNSHAFEQASKQSRRGRGPRTANPIPTTTFSDSEERIVDEVKMQILAPPPPPPPPPPKPKQAIRRHVEIEVVHEARTDTASLRLDPEDGRASTDGNFAFARGPRRSSGFGLRKGPG